MKRSLSIIGIIFALSLAWHLGGTNRGSASSAVSERNFLFSYSLGIANIPPDADNVEIWIPLPPTDEYQNIKDYKISSPIDSDIYIDPDYGNKVIALKTSKRVPESIKVWIDFDVARLEAAPLSNNRPVEQKQNLERFLMPNRLVPIDGRIADEARQAINVAKTDIEKARALYDHLMTTMRYDKSGAGWGRGDALYACDARKGNCTDIHSLFIGMARSIGIPARFKMGFPLPEDKSEGEVAGYHCWAEFYIDGKGWIPVDISEAIKHPEKTEYYFGRLDPNRIDFTTGRDIRLRSGDEYKTLNYFIYPYVLVDGEPFEEIEYNFRFARK